MRFRLEATDAASTKAGIAVTPALPGIQHPASSITHSKDRRAGAGHGFQRGDGEIGGPARVHELVARGVEHGEPHELSLCSHRSFRAEPSPSSVER